MTTENVPAPRTPPIEPPNGLASDFLRRILGFGVWFAIGLAPFLGRVHVPGFTAVIDMYPVELRNWLIPLSGLLMGMIAVAVDYAASRKKKTRAFEKIVHRRFVRTVVLFAAAFAVLIFVYVFAVARVSHSTASGELISSAIITGAQQVPPQPPGSLCKCPPRQDVNECIGDISLNPAYIRTCFGSNRIALATFVLALLYLTVTGAFAAAVGIQLVAQRARRAR